MTSLQRSRPAPLAALRPGDVLPIAVGRAMSYGVTRRLKATGEPFRFVPGCFASSLASRSVFAAHEHDKSATLRLGTLADDTLRLWEVSGGLGFALRLDSAAAGRWDALSAFRGGRRCGLSISYEGDASDLLPGPGGVSRLPRATLIEVSVLTHSTPFDPTSFAAFEVGCAMCWAHGFVGTSGLDARRAPRCRRCGVAHRLAL